jgi:hypothetical protein
MKVCFDSTRTAVSNEDVIRMYLSGSFPEDKMPVWGTANLKITKRTNGWALINYSTPLLYHEGSPSDPDWLSVPFDFNKDKYSVTTSKIQNQIRRVSEEQGVQLNEISENEMPQDSRLYRKRKGLFQDLMMGESGGWTFNFGEFIDAVGPDIPVTEAMNLWDDFLEYRSDAMSDREHLENWIAEKLPEKYAKKIKSSFDADVDLWFDYLAETGGNDELVRISKMSPTKVNLEKFKEALAGSILMPEVIDMLMHTISNIEMGAYSDEFRFKYGLHSAVSEFFSMVRQALTYEEKELRETGKRMKRIRKGQWEKLPKGWTEASLESFWKSLTGDVAHKVTKCIKKMEGVEGVDDPGAFCASLADKIEGTTEWRGRD